MSYVIAALIFVLTASAQTRPQYDLILKGGHVIDPKNNINGPMDVAVQNGKVARVAANIPATEAAKSVDVAGLYVTPGLIDLHVHVYLWREPGGVEHQFHPEPLRIADPGVMVGRREPQARRQRRPQPHRFGRAANRCFGKSRRCRVVQS